MDEIRQDLLSLNYSPSFQISGMQEADVNLSLPPATLSASISGSVTGGALPLADATVKLFDSSGAPFMHTVTDASGSFSFDVVPAGTYSRNALRWRQRLCLPRLYAGDSSLPRCRRRHGQLCRARL